MPRKKGMAAGLSPMKRLSPAPLDFSELHQPRYPSPGSGGQYPPPRRKTTPPLPPALPGGDGSWESAEAGASRLLELPCGGGSQSDEADLRYRHKKFKKMASTVDEVAASDTGESSHSERGKSSPSPTASVNGGAAAGRYVCPYCKLACAKPSVLQKHIRAHTNERPYPCVPCGFAFKTKSNLYKHCRSRAHALKALGRDETGKLLPPEELLPSDPEEDGEEEGCPTPETPPLVVPPQFLNSSPGAAYSPPDTSKARSIYKPKFHTALYEPEPEPPRSLSPTRGKMPLSPMCYSPGAPSPEFLQRHISKIISDNQAIVETMDPLWPRKFLRQQSSREELASPPSQPPWPKKLLRQVSAGPCFPSQETPTPAPHTASSRLALALLRPRQHEEPPVLTLQGGATVTLEPSKPRSTASPHQQPLNLCLNNHATEHRGDRKRGFSESSPVRELLAGWGQQKLVRSDGPAPDKAFHPQNPEGSIIKDLLLKARGGVDVMELLNSEHLAPTGDDPYSSQAFTCNVCRIQYRNADNLEVHQRYYCKGAEPAKEQRKVTPPRSRSKEEASRMAAAVELVALSTPPPFPSPGPLLGSTPLVGGYISSQDQSPPLKKRRVHSMCEERPPSACSLRSLEELSRASHPRPNSLQMFGGKVHINDGSETKTMIIDPGRGAPSSGSLLGMSSMEEPPRSEKSGSGRSPTNIVVTIARSNLNSGGTIVQKAGHTTAACTSVSYSVSSVSTTLVPDQQLLAAVSRPIVPKISTPSLAPSLHHHPGLSPFLASQMARLTPTFNPLTLPLQTPRSPDGVVTILHGGREIPYVPGMPGPQSLSESRPLDLCSPTSAPPSRLTAEAPLTPSPTKRPVRRPPSPPPAPSHSKASPPRPPSPPAATPPRISAPQASPLLPSIRVETESTAAPASIPSAPAQSTAQAAEASNKKFLRPTSLPLKPGTFVPKKSVGSLPGMVSPETPRPRKSYGQLYLNGHAYTYLGLKCSTRVFFCCLNRPQPMYVPQSTDPRLSMYSNWKVCAPSSEPAGEPGRAMALYDSRHRPAGYTVARSRQLPLKVIHSSQWRRHPPVQARSEGGKSKDPAFAEDEGSTSKSAEGSSSTCGEPAPKRVKIFAGGFESNEEYTYVRGRGRGRYVCEECGIRCKKPSMLKKHIRTHTDVRPFTCKHCSFSFKTKGNLTKHMKSKAHYKKCMEMGIIPVPTVVDDSYIDEESLAKQQALRTARGEDGAESDSDSEEEDEDEDEEEEDDDLQLADGDSGASRPEREAACSLLSLSDQHSGLIPLCARPSTYPYSYGPPSSSAIAHTPTIVGPVSAHSEREKVSRNTHLASGPAGNTPHCSTATSSASCRGDSSRYYFPSRRDQSSPPQGGESTSADEDTSQPVTSSSSSSSNSSLPATPPPMDLSRATQPAVHTPVTPVPDSAALLAALCNTVERLPPKLPSAPSTESPAETPMLQAYLTERALQDVRIKQHQLHKWKGYGALGSTASTPTTPTTPLSPSVWSGQTTLLTPTLTNAPPSLLKHRSPDAPEKAFCDLPQMISVISTSLTTVLTTSVSVITSTMTTSVAESSSMATEPPRRAPPAETLPSKKTAQQHAASAALAAASSVHSPPSPSLAVSKPKAEFFPPASGPSASYARWASVTEDGKSICVICNKVFSKPSQLRLHVNIHYFERPFRCESCAVSFRTKGHLQKHERSVSHQNKVSMNSTFGMPTTDNPRPFKCEDCKIAFRIHGHLAKHLRSKMHIMKLECLGKLPFGTYAEMERSGINLNEIDTTDCDNSLESLQILAQKLYEKDPSKLQQWERRRTLSESSEDIDDVGEPYPPSALQPAHLAVLGLSGEEAQSRLLGSDYEEASEGESDVAPAEETPQHFSCSACSDSFASLEALQIHDSVIHHVGTPETWVDREPPAGPSHESAEHHTETRAVWQRQNLTEARVGGSPPSLSPSQAVHLPPSPCQREDRTSPDTSPYQRGNRTSPPDPLFNSCVILEPLPAAPDQQQTPIPSSSSIAIPPSLATSVEHVNENQLPAPCSDSVNPLSSEPMEIQPPSNPTSLADPPSSINHEPSIISTTNPDTPVKHRVKKKRNKQLGFRCKICSILVPTRKDLKKHTASHAVVLPFLCQICDAFFTSKAVLLNHLALHRPASSSADPSGLAPLL